MKRAALWWFWQTAAVLLFWLGYYTGVEGAKNCFLFLIWFTFLCTLGLLSKDAQDEFRKNGRPVPALLMNAFDIAFTLVLVWHGLWWTSAAFALTAMMQLGTYEMKPKEAPAP